MSRKEDNLIPKDLSKRPDHKELARKGGKVKSKAKTLANQIKGLKTASEDKKQEHFNRLLKDPDYSILDLIKFAEEIKVFGKDRIALLQARIKLHQAAHGAKQNVEVHTAQEVTELIKQWLKPTNLTNGASTEASTTNPTQDKLNSTTAPPVSEHSPAEDDGAKH